MCSISGACCFVEICKIRHTFRVTYVFINRCKACTPGNVFCSFFPTQESLHKGKALIESAVQLAESKECDPKEISDKASQLEAQVNSFEETVIRRKLILKMATNFFQCTDKVWVILRIYSIISENTFNTVWNIPFNDSYHGILSLRTDHLNNRKVLLFLILM